MRKKEIEKQNLDCTFGGVQRCAAWTLESARASYGVRRSTLPTFSLIPHLTFLVVEEEEEEVWEEMGDLLLCKTNIRPLINRECCKAQ